ncbi:kinase-like domain-containing protein [Hypoxylon argillaceum]|nr:kinase-like domain-containing protein [Hypoxylon argillaceum]
MLEYDPDVIAYLYACEGFPAERTIKVYNQRLAERAQRIPSSQTRDRNARATTEEPSDVNDLEGRDRLVLRFSNPPKTNRGFVAGRSEKADIVLDDAPGVSWYHFTLTFDLQSFLIVRDLNSTNGTCVIYDGEDSQGACGVGVDWSACGPRLARDKVPIIQVIAGLKLRLVVPNHDVTSQTYLNNVARFLQDTAGAEDLLSELVLQTGPETEQQTPSAEVRGPFFWTKELGRGSFGVVSYAWDVTTREEYALKEALRPERGEWDREIEILKGISHDHIVKLKHAELLPTPKLYFEFALQGSLQRYIDQPTGLTTTQTRQVAIQLLDGLAYLHGKKPPVAHRDIKPDNILVKQWSHHKIHVMFADFGLSKQADYFKTSCGTKLYAAPEIFSAWGFQGKAAFRYNPLVDIWSLAVLLVQLECGALPKYDSGLYDSAATAWGEAMVEFASNYVQEHGSNALLDFVRENMLIVHPKSGRQTAEKCYEKAVQLFRASASGPGTRNEHYPGDGESNDEESGAATPRGFPSVEDDSQSLQGRICQWADAPAPDTAQQPPVTQGGLWGAESGTGAHGSPDDSAHYDSVDLRLREAVGGYLARGREEAADTPHKRPRPKQSHNSEAMSMLSKPAVRKQRME